VGLEHLHEVIDNIEDMGIVRVPEVIQYIPNLVEARRKQDMENLARISTEIEQSYGVPKVAPAMFNRSFIGRSHGAKKSIFDYRSKEFAQVQENFLQLAATVEEWADGKAN
jgi:chromosome partitioning protein